LDSGFCDSCHSGINRMCAGMDFRRTPCVGAFLEQFREHTFSIAGEVYHYSSLAVTHVHRLLFFLLNKFRTIRLDSFPQARGGIVNHYNNCSNVCGLDLAVFYQVRICCSAKNYYGNIPKKGGPNMRILKLQMQMSVDGFVAGPNGEMDWLVWNWDDKLKEYVKEITAPVDCILLGRKLAQGFIPTWASHLADPKTADVFAKKMVDTHKLVFTKTLAKSDWQNTDIVKGDLIQEVNKEKNKDGGDIIVYGGAAFVSALINAGLIDQFHLFINPVIIGKGMTIFKELAQKQDLTLVKSTAFECGIVLLNYKRK